MQTIDYPFQSIEQAISEIELFRSSYIKQHQSNQMS